MAMLNFKKGVYSALPKTISEGTIYVTTDEKAMYVDISATERIRLGQICVVDTIEAWENLKPPFSQEAFYYVVENNALLRNNGTAETPKWTQLNSVSDITADLSNLTNRMDKVEGDVVAAATAAATADGKAVAAQERADEAANAASVADGKAVAAQERADEAYALAEEGKGIAEQGVADAEAAQKTADAAATAAATADGKAVAAQQKADDAYVLAEEAKEAAEKAQGTADGAQSRADEAWDLADEAKGAAANAQTTANAANTLASTANTNAGLASEAAATNKQLIEAQDERLQAVEEAIGTGDGTSLADRIGALEDTVNDPTSGVAKNYERLNAIDTKFNSYSTTSEMNSAIDNKLADYSTTEQMNAAIADKLENYSTTEEVNEAIESTVGALKTEVNTKFESYSTTEQMNTAIDNKLADYSTTTEVNTAIDNKLANYSTTEQMNAAIEGAVGELETEVNTKFNSYSTTTEMNTAISGALEDYSTTEEVNSTIANELKNYSTTTQMETAINTAVGNLKTEINTKLVDYSTTTQMNEAIDSAISSAIAANDAMTYKGVVTVDDNGEDDLPTAADGVSIGDTYKVGRDGYYDGTLCYVGDLLIANVKEGYEEDENGLIPADGLIWNHIESGYEDGKEPTLSGDNGNIYLTSAVAAEADKGNLGTIAVMSMNENLKVSVSDNAITMSLEWGSFETA